MTTLYRYSHDPEARAGYVTVGEGQVTETVDLGGNVLIDIDANGDAIGFELLDAPTEAFVKRWAAALARIRKGDRK